MERYRTLSRRDLLKFAGIGTAELLFSSCTPPQRPSNTNPNERPRPTVTPENQALGEHDRFHYRSEGKELPTTPFLYLPFSRVDFGKITVAQGWEANEDEKARSKVTTHQGIDFAAPYGTKVVASCDGIAIASLQEGWRQVNEKIVTFEGKKVAYGGGIFVEIAHANGQRVQYLHLASLNPNIPFSKPTKTKEGGWEPTGNNLPFEELKKFGKEVKAGDFLGTVGYTGLGLDSLGKYQGEERPAAVFDGELPTWDVIGAHLHFEVFARRENKTKFARRDPFAIYGTTDKYSLDGKKPLGKDPLFIVNQGIPQTTARLTLRELGQLLHGIFKHA